jgi:ATP-binding cassette subfamily C (CFTR/MRP) protein 1
MDEMTSRHHVSNVVAVTSFFCDLAPQLGCWLAARQMHIVMLHGVMRAPLTFFDTTPIGRIISRFAKDVDVLDTSLPQQISDSIYCTFEVILMSEHETTRTTIL